MNNICIIRRKVDNECYSCGGEIITEMYFVDSSDIARHLVGVLNFEFKAMKQAVHYRFTENDGENTIHRDNWRELASQAIQLDKDFFKDTVLETSLYVEYDFVEVGRFAGIATTS